MEQRISLITLAVADLARSHEFYIEGLGWVPELYVPGEVLMIRAGEHLILSLWAAEEFEREVGGLSRGTGGTPPITLAHNVATVEEVDAVLDLARRSGADPIIPATHREWGGYSGYFADPDGFRWEIAMNPGPIGETLLPDSAKK